MRDLFDIQKELQDTNATLSRIELSLVKQPDLPSVHATIKGLQTRQKVLEAEFLKAANERGQDVCSYRVFPNAGQATIEAVSKALISFQSLFTIIYDVVKHGPKDRVRSSEKVEKETAFNFGYTFPGSVGVVFTLPNDRLLPGMMTDVDVSMHTIRTLAKADSTTKITALVKELGEAPIRAGYKWAKDHAEYRLGADIGWRRGESIKEEFLVQYLELDQLQSTIAMSGAETVEIITLRGLLVAVNTVRHTFHLVEENTDTDIRGKFTDAISEEHTVILPARYTAIIRKTTIIQYSSEQPDIQYFLEALKSVE